MMRKNSRWVYLLFIVVLEAVCAVGFRDVGVPTMLLGLWFVVPFYERLLKKQASHWLIPCCFAGVLALGGFYYLADLLVFPNSVRAAHRLHDACGIGIIWSLGSLLMAWGAVQIEGRRFPAVQGGAE